MQVLTLVLPILWAIVAAVIGLALYRSSAALFDSATTNASTKRRIRLTGSVAIAGFAFFAMRSATPRERLDMSHNLVLSQANEIDRATMDAMGALASNDVISCKAALSRIPAATAAIREQFKADDGQVMPRR
jgi:azurin